MIGFALCGSFCTVSEALEQLCGRHPDKVLIYSLPLGDTVSIPV